jgi:hypothetical protein
MSNVNKHGFSVVEALLASSLFALFLLVFVGALTYGTEGGRLAGDRARAAYLAEEGIEAVRNIRDESFANLTDGDWGLVNTSGVWEFSGSSDVTDNFFNRTVTVSTVDGSSKDVRVNVGWDQTPQRTGLVSLVMRFTDWARIATNDWINPVLDGVLDIADTHNGWRIQMQGDYAYMIRLDNGASPDFVAIDITDSANPIQVDSLDLVGAPVNLDIDGNFAYVTNRDNSAEFQVVDISDPLNLSVVTYGLPTNRDAIGIDVVGGLAYVTRAGGRFDIVDVSDGSIVGTTNLGGTGAEVVVMGNYAYVASFANGAELEIVDVSVSGSPALVNSYNLPGGANGFSIAGLSNSIFLGRTTGILYVFDVTDPTSPLPVPSEFDAGARVNDIAIDGGNLVFLGTRNATQEFQVVDLNDLNAPYGVLDIVDDVNGIAYDLVNNRVYAATSDDDAEFIVILPQ